MAGSWALLFESGEELCEPLRALLKRAGRELRGAGESNGVDEELGLGLRRKSRLRRGAEACGEGLAKKCKFAAGRYDGAPRDAVAGAALNLAPYFGIEHAGSVD